MLATRTRALREGFRLPWLLVLILLVVPVHAAADSDPAVPVLVKTAVPLTPDVVTALSTKSVKVSNVWTDIRALALTVKTSGLAELRASPLVALVEDDLSVPFESREDESPESSLIPEVLSATPIQTWNQDMANTTGSGWSGAGVTVAVVDAGLPQNWEEFLPAGCVDLDHATGFGAEGWGDYHNPVKAIRGVGGHVGQFPHGLAVSSVIVGFPSEFGPIGGAAPDAKILPIRVLNQFNFGWISWFTAGIMHVGRLKASGALAGPVVINFSIQIHASSQVLTDAIDYAISQGVLFVTIAGNFHPVDPVSFPGRLPESITAGAVGWRSEGVAPTPWFFADVPEGDASQVYVAPFSGREPASVPPGSQVDVLAPGSFVFGEWAFGPGFSEGREVAFDRVDNFIFGTSFAAPHVAGIVAQMLQKNATLNQVQAEAILRSTALHIPDSPSSFFTPLGVPVFPWDARATGAGLVQGTAALAITPAVVMTQAAPDIRSIEGGAAPRPSRLARVVTPLGQIPVEIEWSAAAGSPVTSTVYDAQGRVVRRWDSVSRAGSFTWDGRDHDGAHVRNGLYFLKLESAGAVATLKVIAVTR